MALEEYIKQVRELWTNYTLDLVNYQNKCRLIRYVMEAMHRILESHMFAGVGTTCSTNAAKT